MEFNIVKFNDISDIPFHRGDAFRNIANSAITFIVNNF